MKPQRHLSAALAVVGIFQILRPGVDRTLAADWPQFLGPGRNGVSAETIATQWPEGGPKTAWSVKVGSGWSGPIVLGDGIGQYGARS